MEPCPISRASAYPLTIILHNLAGPGYVFLKQAVVPGVELGYEGKCCDFKKTKSIPSTIKQAATIQLIFSFNTPGAYMRTKKASTRS